MQKKHMGHFSLYVALAVMGLFLFSSIPAAASHIGPDGIELNRGIRGHEFEDHNGPTEYTGSNPFTGGKHPPMRPDRPNQFVVNHDDDQTICDDDSPNDHTGVQNPTPFEGDDNPTLPNEDTPTAPVPEPTTLALMAPAVLGLVRKFRK
jgi:hypothetical protein